MRVSLRWRLMALRLARRPLASVSNAVVRLRSDGQSFQLALS